MAKKPARAAAKRPSRSLPRGPRQAERDARLRARSTARRTEVSNGAAEGEQPAEPSREDQKAAQRLHVREERRGAIIYAPNWRTPLIVDIVGGIVVFLAGAVFAVLWSPFIAGGIGALGGLYAALAVRRWRLWASRRRAAGLPT